MGMVLTKNVTDAGGGLLKGLVAGQTALVHGVQDPAVDRLQAVTNVGQGTAHDDGHGVFNVGTLHFVHQIAGGDHLIRETDVLRFVASIVCHKAPPG